MIIVELKLKVLASNTVFIYRYYNGKYDQPASDKTRSGMILGITPPRTAPGPRTETMTHRGSETTLCYDYGNVIASMQYSTHEQYPEMIPQMQFSNQHCWAHLFQFMTSVRAEKVRPWESPWGIRLLFIQ